MGVCQYAHCLNVIAASGYVLGSASGMNRAGIGYMHRGTDQVITLSVELGEGGLGACPSTPNPGLLPVSVNKSVPPEKNIRGVISIQNTKSGAGEQFLLQDCRAKAGAKGFQ